MKPAPNPPRFGVVSATPHGLQYLQGPRTPDKVKRDGYGFTNDPAGFWTFPTEAAAAAKARILDAHIGWGAGLSKAFQVEVQMERCPFCDGSGRDEYDEGGKPRDDFYRCESCEGTGWIKEVAP